MRERRRSGRAALIAFVGLLYSGAHAQCLGIGASCSPGLYNVCNPIYAQCPVSCTSGIYCLACPSGMYCEDGEVYGTCASVACPDGLTLNMDLAQTSCNCIVPPTPNPTSTLTRGVSASGSETPSGSLTPSNSASGSGTPSSSTTASVTATPTSSITRGYSASVTASKTGTRSPTVSRSAASTPSNTKSFGAVDRTPTASHTKTCNIPRDSNVRCDADPESSPRPKDQHSWGGMSGWLSFDSALNDYSRNGGKLFFFLRGYVDKPPQLPK